MSMNYSYEELSRVCMKQSHRHKTIFSEVDLTKVKQVNKQGNKLVEGDTITFAGFKTYLPITVCEEAVTRLNE